LGNIIAVLITLINTAAITIKLFIFEQAAKGEEKGIMIWWMCCLKIGGSKKFKMNQDEKIRKLEKKP
jgi:hypothetical protein